MSAILSAHSFDVVEIILSHLALLSLSILPDSQYHTQAPIIHPTGQPIEVQIIDHAVHVTYF
jgi:hypothetical protein